jgi:hypothetical protein
MKRSLLILIMLVSLLGTASTATAGTWFTGGKLWYTSWDSGILDWLEKDIALSYVQNFSSFSANRDPGSGYLAGPLLGYQTDNGKWSFSFAPMILSDFNQDWSGTANGQPLDGQVKLERADYDLAANYALSDRYKLFYGLKYQDMELEFTIVRPFGNTGPPTNIFYIDAEALIPTVGVGAVYPLGSKTVASGQLGLLYAFTDLYVSSNISSDTDNIWPHPGFGYNMEGNITWQAANSLLVQGGLRYQLFTIEARGPGRDTRTRSYDITYGGTMAVVYTF